MNNLGTNNVNFGTNIAKVRQALCDATKTPRSYPIKNVSRILNSLGYNETRCRGTNFIYKNAAGDVFEFDGGSSIANPKTVKQLQNLIRLSSVV